MYPPQNEKIRLKTSSVCFHPFTSLMFRSNPWAPITFIPNWNENIPRKLEQLGQILKAKFENLSSNLYPVIFNRFIVLLLESLRFRLPTKNKTTVTHRNNLVTFFRPRKLFIDHTAFWNVICLLLPFIRFRHRWLQWIHLVPWILRLWATSILQTNPLEFCYNHRWLLIRAGTIRYQTNDAWRSPQFTWSNDVQCTWNGVEGTIQISFHRIEVSTKVWSCRAQMLLSPKWMCYEDNRLIR